MDRRLETLGFCHWDDPGALLTAHLLIPQARTKEGEQKTVTLWDKMREQHEMTVFVARYLHQPLPVLEAMSPTDLREHYETTKALVLAELGGKKATDTDVDGDWV